MNERLPSECVVVTTTVADRPAAERIARLPVEACLAACAQIVPIHSVYRWKGAIESADELRIQFKTTAACVAALLELIRANHPYDVPEIIVTPVIGGHPPYLDWIRAETRGGPGQ